MRLRRFCLHHQRTERMKRDIVRRCTINLLVASLDDQQMAILHTRMKLHPLIAEMLLQVFHQDIGILGRDMTCRMVFQDVAFNAHDVASHRHITRLKLHPNTGGLQRATALVHLREVIAHHGHIGYLASRMKAIGHGDKFPRPTLACQHIHIRSMRVLQKGLITQGGGWPIGHTIS